MSEIRRLYLPLLSQLMTGLKAFETVDSNSIEEDLEEEDISEEMTDLNEKHINDDSLTLINSNEHAQVKDKFSDVFHNFLLGLSKDHLKLSQNNAFCLCKSNSMYFCVYVLYSLLHCSSNSQEICRSF